MCSSPLPEGSSSRRGVPPPKSLQVSLESCPVLPLLASSLTAGAAALPSRRFFLTCLYGILVLPQDLL